MASRYFYLLDVDDDVVVAAHPVAAGLTGQEIARLECRLRAEQRVDDPDSGLALRDTALHPLPAEILAYLSAKGA